MYPYIEIFSIDIPTYWVLMMIGMLAAGTLVYVINKKHPHYQLPTADVLYLALYVAIGAILGARVLYIITHIPNMFRDPAYIVSALTGGSVFYGGVIGGALMGWFYLRQYGLNPRLYVNLLIIGVPLGHAFGRLGCFMAGCCHGTHTDHAFGVVFPEGPLHSGHGPAVHPTQLYEVAFNLVLLAILVFLFFHFKKHKPYVFIGLYAVFYGVFRFINEFFRGDDIRGIFILSTSQWISIFIVSFGVFVLLSDTKRYAFLGPKPPRNKAYIRYLEQKQQAKINQHVKED